METAIWRAAAAARLGRRVQQRDALLFRTSQRLRVRAAPASTSCFSSLALAPRASPFPGAV
eukprot:6178732-Pleurochrysis_carterae.AAC.3